MHSIYHEIQDYLADYKIASGSLSGSAAGVLRIISSGNYAGNDSLSGSLQSAESAKTRVRSSFNVSGSNYVVQFEKYATTDITPRKFTIFNESNISALQFFPTSSSDSRLIFTSASVPLTKANPLTLPPKSGSVSSSIDLYVDVDINGLNVLPEETDLAGNQLVQDIAFNVVALDLGVTSEAAALPGFPADTRIFDINFLSQTWKNYMPFQGNVPATGRDGLGEGNLPFKETDPQYYNTIRFTDKVLLEKFEKFTKFSDLIDKGIFALGRDYFLGNSAQENRALLSYIIYAILFPSKYPKVNFDNFNNIPWSGAPWTNNQYNRALVRSVFSGWGLPIAFYPNEFFGNMGVFSGLNYPKDVVAAYLTLINLALQPTEDYSTELPKIITTGFIPTEQSRTDITVGTYDIDIVRAKYSVTNAILSASKELIQAKTAQFFDEQREYKTILNFGDDKHYVAEAWRPVPDTASIQLKLVKPLQNGVTLYDEAYIVREFAQPVVDIINVELPPVVDDSPFLRPANTNVGKFDINKQSIKNVTLTTLGMDTGSVGVISGSTISYDDRIFNRWFTADFNSSELNIDFSDYANFVFFGSAKARLNAFANKLQKIQTYGNSISVSSSNASERRLAIEKESIIRNFDPYEQYLYFASQSNAYSASVYYVEGETEYNPTGSWPKDSNMVPLAYTTVESWYDTQTKIAERFDEFNANYLIKHLPEHIQEDANSTDFITFIQMFGHVMDNIKVYIDRFSDIYSTNPDPFKELTMDQVYEVGKSFGMDLPNAYSLENLESFISSLYDGQGTRARLAETWKRFLHSSIYLKKLKGSRTGVDAVINTFGLNSPLVQLKESTYAVEGNYIKSDELVYGLHFTGSVSSSVRIPFVSSSYTASTLQMRFAPDRNVTSTVLSSPSTWAIDVIPHPSSSEDSFFNTQSRKDLTSYYTLEPQVKNYGKINLVSGSSRTVIASSSYFELFGDTYTHIMLRSQSQDLVIIQTDGDQILYQHSASVTWGNLWNNTTHVYVGGSGSIKIGVFDGVIDDVRVWGENTTFDNFTKQAYDPGSYYGSNYSSSYDSLYVDVSFSQPYASITQSATNESPFSGVANLSNLPAQGFTTASHVRVLRTIKQFTPIVGSSIFSNRKVTVATPPVFSGDFIDSDGVKTLKTKSSIKSVEEKKYVGGQDYVQFAVSPTDFVNQTIMRSMGDVDTNYLIGSPRKYDNENYQELNDIFEFFLEKYNESINVNEYIRFFNNVLKAPSDYIETYVPARSKLVDGVVIESPFLYRRKTYIQKSIKVDGSNTITFDNFVSGSGSANVGAYDFLAEYPRVPEVDTTIISKPVLQKFGLYTVTSSLMSTNGGVSIIDAPIELTSSVGPVSSTIPSKLASGKQLLQKIGVSGYISSSLADRNSGIGFVDAYVTASARTYVTQSGYSRNPYLGLRYYASQIYRIPSEQNTLTPFYEIGPTSDFSDAGTTTYFYNTTGLYWLPSTQAAPKEYPFKKVLYRAKLDVPMGEIQSAAAKELNNITLLSPDVLTDYPGRTKLTINGREYAANSTYKGTLNIANIFSLFNVEGNSGLRLRLYRSVIDQNNDVGRSFSTIPSLSAGVLFDGLLGDGEVFPYTLVQTTNSTIYFTVDNLTGSSIASAIELTYFEYEPAKLSPEGYLPRHYKFTRTKNLATLRRSYLGCRTVYCPEGCPPDVTESEPDSPVQIFLTPRTSPVVSNTGGGGGIPTGITPGTIPNLPGNDPLNDVLRQGTRGKLTDARK